MMNRGKHIWTLAALTLVSTAFYRCSDWTEVEPEQITQYSNTEAAKPESYYRALREWKNSEHSISFGWFSGWGEPAASMGGMLAGLPDSMDMVSIWGKWHSLSPGKIKDLRYVQEVKGTKVVFASFTRYVGQNITPAEIAEQGTAAVEAYWGWVEKDEAAIESAIRKYARAFVDSVYKYGYDGFDMDHEPNFGGAGKIASYPNYVHIFFTEMREQFDQRGGDKLIILDGQPQSLKPESGPIVDWFIVQAYTVTGTPLPNATGTEADKDTRLNTCINNYTGILTPQEVTNKYVITENMESAIDALNGGFFWRLRDGTKLDKSVYPSLVGFAMWEPLNGFRKGGFGGYRFDAESVNKPPYKWMRRAIQAQNPAVN